MQRLIYTLFCLIFLTGCALDKPVATISRFPEYPPEALAKAPSQDLISSGKQSAFTIQGGWGYKKADACAFALPKSSYGRRTKTLPLERQLVLVRNEVEFYDTPPPGQRYAVIDYGTVTRTIGTQEGRTYAIWRGRVHIVSEATAPALYQASINKPFIKRATAQAMRDARIVSREYWFDITEMQ